MQRATAIEPTPEPTPDAPAFPCTINRHDSREEWLAFRRLGIGASDAATILGLNRWSSPLSLFIEKIGEAPAHAETEAMRWGNRLEPVVAHAYLEETGRHAVDLGRHTVLQSHALPWQMATLDRLLMENARSGIKPEAVLEIKTTSAFRKEDWADGPPAYYWTQLQHQLAVTGLPWGSLVVLIGGQELLWQDVQRNEEFIHEMTAQEAVFWDNVLSRTPPRADASEACTKAIAHFYRDVVAETVVLDAEADEWDEKLVQVKAQLKDLEEEKRLYENSLRAAIGHAEAARTPGGVEFTLKTINRKEHYVAASSYRQLRRKGE